MGFVLYHHAEAKCRCILIRYFWHIVQIYKSHKEMSRSRSLFWMNRRINHK
jgi:hypothetical protein